MKAEERYKKLYEKVNQMTFSEINIYQLLDSANEAVSLTYAQHKTTRNDKVLAELKHIKDHLIRPMLDDEMVLKEMRQRFYDSKTGLTASLKRVLGNALQPV